MPRLQAGKMKAKNYNEEKNGLKTAIDDFPLRKKDKPEPLELNSFYHSTNWKKEQHKDCELL